MLIYRDTNTRKTRIRYVHTMLHSQNRNTDFPELVTAVKNTLWKNSGCWFNLFCVAADFANSAYQWGKKREKQGLTPFCLTCKTIKSWALRNFNSMEAQTEHLRALLLTLWMVIDRCINKEKEFFNVSVLSVFVTHN